MIAAGPATFSSPKQICSTLNSYSMDNQKTQISQQTNISSRMNAACQINQQKRKARCNSAMKQRQMQQVHLHITCAMNVCSGCRHGGHLVLKLIMQTREVVVWMFVKLSLQ